MKLFVLLTFSFGFVVCTPRDRERDWDRETEYSEEYPEYYPDCYPEYYSEYYPEYCPEYPEYPGNLGINWNLKDL